MSPVRSKKQFKWLIINRPEILEKWQHEQRRKYSSLPLRKKKRKKR